MPARYEGEQIDLLVAKGKYSQALALVEAGLDEDPSSFRLRQQYGDLLARTGETARAVEVLDSLVSELVDEGFVAHGIAVLKKMQRVAPDRADVEERLATLVRERLGEDSPEARVQPRRPEVKLQLFGDFLLEQLTAVIKGLKLASFEPGDVIVTEGEPGDSLLVLASGEVKVFVRDAEGHNEKVRSLGHGEVFGEISVVTGQPRTATVTAASDCEILELDRETLDSIAEDHPQVPAIISRFSEQREGSPEEQAARSGSDD